MAGRAHAQARSKATAAHRSLLLQLFPGFESFLFDLLSQLVVLCYLFVHGPPLNVTTFGLGQNALWILV